VLGDILIPLFSIKIKGVKSDPPLSFGYRHNKPKLFTDEETHHDGCDFHVCVAKKHRQYNKPEQN